MQLVVNWGTGANTVTLTQGQNVTIQCPGCRFLAYEIFTYDNEGNRFIAHIGQTQIGKDNDSFILAYAGKDLKGPATLKLNAWDSSWQMFGFEKDFQII